MVVRSVGAGADAGVARAADDWETVEDEDAQIKVRARTDINGKEVWAEKDVEANAVDVQAALMDAGAFRLWMPFVKESRWWRRTGNARVACPAGLPGGG